MLEHIFDLIAPHLCVSCQREGAILCPDCALKLTAPPLRCYICERKTPKRVCAGCSTSTPLDAIVVAAGYEAAVKQLVHRLKFERTAAAAKMMALLMAQQLGDTPEQAIVTHAPTATRRVRIRGYDQSRLIARHLAKELGLPYRSVLIRSGQARQLGTDRWQRKEQMQSAFSMRAARLAPNTNVILVDDVLTTGSTLEAAGTALKQAGAEHITAAVFAAAELLRK